MTPSEMVLLALLNGLTWGAIHLGWAALGTRLPADWFNPDGSWYRPRRWEGNGRLYQKIFRIRYWKDRLPDGAAWFRSGFPKAQLLHREPSYLQRFTRETCRGEFVHWSVAAMAPLFFLWNPPWAGWVMVIYGLSANLPCILVQRYNRIRLMRTWGERKP